MLLGAAKCCKEVQTGSASAGAACPFYPRQQTSVRRRSGPFRAKNRTHALQQTPASFDYFVGPDQRCGVEPHAELGGYLLV